MNIDKEIERIDRQIRELKALRYELGRMRSRIERNSLDSYMEELLDIIRRNPGIDRYSIVEVMKLTPVREYNNTMTSLRRRGLIFNKGTRQKPLYHTTRKGK